jgi:hypothetical protein
MLLSEDSKQLLEEDWNESKNIIVESPNEFGLICHYRKGRLNVRMKLNGIFLHERLFPCYVGQIFKTKDITFIKGVIFPNLDILRISLIFIILLTGQSIYLKSLIPILCSFVVLIFIIPCIISYYIFRRSLRDRLFAYLNCYGPVEEMYEPHRISVFSLITFFGVWVYNG